jgi:hypothetical protein
MLALTADARRIYTSNVADGTVSELDVPGRKFLREFNVAPAVEGIAVTLTATGYGSGATRRTVAILDPRAGQAAGTMSGFGMPYRLAVTRTVAPCHHGPT